MTARKRFDGKVMVVTGAAQGIGRTVAVNAAQEGAAVVLIDRADFVHEVGQELTAGGAEALAVTADLETYAGAERAAASTSWSTMSAVRSGPSPMPSTGSRRSRRKSAAPCFRRCGAAARCCRS
jgi:hypothetical protein